MEYLTCWLICTWWWSIFVIGVFDLFVNFCWVLCSWITSCYNITGVRLFIELTVVISVNGKAWPGKNNVCRMWLTTPVSLYRAFGFATQHKRWWFCCTIPAVYLATTCAGAGVLCVLQPLNQVRAHCYDWLLGVLKLPRCWFNSGVAGKNAVCVAVCNSKWSRNFVGILYTLYLLDHWNTGVYRTKNNHFLHHR